MRPRPSAERSSPARWRQVLLPFLLSLFRGALPDQIRYSIPEELAKNSVVGNLAKDLGLSVRDLPARKLRVSAEKEYFTVNPESGDLLVSDRIDREQICGKKPLCILDFDTVAENPLNIFHVAVIVQDINDNTPLFKQNNIDLKIGESTKPGKTFPLDPALDSDAGPNSLQRYHLNDNEHFDLIEKQAPDGRKYPELVLKHSLDREEQNLHQLVLTAVDGGDPPQSGTAQIQIQVTDANDNAPVFIQDVYKVSLQEGVPLGFSVLQVTATDQDEGVNAEITYSFHHVDELVEKFFNLDKRTGEITTKDNFDFEIANSYSLSVEAKDHGDLAAYCSIQVEILDENDCAPEMVITSVFTPLPEDSPPGTVIALIKTRDRDSGENGEVYCRILGKAEFILKSYSKNYYKLVTDGPLDREENPEYNITIMATDRGKPPLSSSINITLHIADVNDNAPVFEQVFYLVHIAENNPPGASIAQVSASDPDLGPNGRVSYSIVASDLEPRALASYVSVSAQSGVVFAQRAFDHEQLRAFELTVQARDQGSPALSANVSLRVLVGDRNDNAPRVLYPALGPDGSALFDTVPRAAQPGYLVTKVVAVDADSGHNAWLSYHVLQASEPGLFSLGLRTGEVRTARALGDRDAARQRLLVAVRDGGQPPLSATATLHLVFADSLQEVLPDVSDRPEPSDPQAELQFYLVVALALISVLFLLAVILAVALRLRRSPSPAAWGCFQSGLRSKSGPGVLPDYREGTLPYSYNLCVASQLAKTEFNFLNVTPEVTPSQDLLCEDAAWLPNTNHEGAGVPFASDTILKGSYVVHVAENNPPGASIFQVSASDPDLGPNGRVSYSIVASDLEPRALASYVSVSAQSGVVFAQRAFDHEQLRAFELTVQARDQGSPALSANVSLRVLVGDRNDNAPRVLYPALGPDGSALFDTVPRAAQPGYLVTKVVAVDADSGHNAWLSYHVLQASEPGLFSLGLRTGEVRTARALGDRDAARQRLLVAVRDGGQPPLSATVTLLLVFADSLQEALPDVSDRLEPSDPQAELQFYLVVALALISVLFLLAVILAVALSLRRSSCPSSWSCFKTDVCSKTGSGVIPNFSEGTLPYSYNLCAASHSSETEFKFLSIKPENGPSQDLLCNEASWFGSANNDNRKMTSNSVNLQQQAPPNTDWRFSQAQRPGTSGSQNGDETGTWPNNQFDTEMLQAMILASASEAADGGSTLGGGAGTMGLSARYGPQFTLQHVPDYRQNVYIPGSNATLTNAAGKRDGKAPTGGNGNKKKSGKKEKK
ncbi:protocadherin gamma-B2 isoform X3 [Leopardus geoffroyi]|uniref:protocadherin gamma-B2 isoform X3 n=1 Tax=Leopardus geoffroyi TaxID=46844 RepID=UPI001E2610C2|nr:protocadherin gamma-B2 isoform X3 [Leopardus geoffroyi]